MILHPIFQALLLLVSGTVNLLFTIPGQDMIPICTCTLHDTLPFLSFWATSQVPLIRHKYQIPQVSTKNKTKHHPISPLQRVVFFHPKGLRKMAPFPSHPLKANRFRVGSRAKTTSQANLQLPFRQPSTSQVYQPSTSQHNLFVPTRNIHPFTKLQLSQTFR